MKTLRLVCLLFLLTPITHAGNPLRGMVIADGNYLVPCDGPNTHWTPIMPVNGAVKKAYLFFTMSKSNVNGADVSLEDPQLAGTQPILEISKYTYTPQPTSFGNVISGDRDQDFGDNYMWADQLGVVISCWGGGQGEARAVIWIDPTIQHP